MGNLNNNVGLEGEAAGGAGCILDESITDNTSPTFDVAQGFINRGLIQFNHSTAFQIRASAVVTVDNDNSTVILVCYEVIVGRGGGQTWTQKITEGGGTLGSEVTSTFNTISHSALLTNVVILTGVSAGVHTYDLESRSSVGNSVALGVNGITAVVLG